MNNSPILEARSAVLSIGRKRKTGYRQTGLWLSPRLFTCFESSAMWGVYSQPVSLDRGITREPLPQRSCSDLESASNAPNGAFTKLRSATSELDMPRGRHICVYVLYADDVVKVDSSFSDVFAFGTAGAFRVARQ